MEFIKKFFRTQAKINDNTVLKMSSPEQDEDPMDVEDENFDQELETVDSPDDNFDAAENTTEDEEDADEENRDPRSFLSTELRPHAITDNNEDSEEEAVLDSYSPAEDNQVDESNDGVDPLNEGENEDGEESNSARELNGGKETLLNGDDKADYYEEDEDSRGKDDNDDPEVNVNVNERNDDDEEEDIDLNRDKKNDDEEQEAVINLNESDKEDEEQEAEIDLQADEKEDEDEDQEKQSNPFADEDSASGDKEENEKEISLIDDEDTNQNENSREKEDLFVAAEDNSNSNSNSNDDSNKKSLFVSNDTNDEDSCDKDANEKKDEVEVLDIGDESDEDDKIDGKGTEDHPVDLEADEEMAKSSNENSPDLRIDEGESSPLNDGIKESKSDEDNEEEMPKIRISNLIFDQHAEEEDDDDNVDIQSMMQVEMMEDDDVEEVPTYEGSNNEVSSSTSKKPTEIAEESPTRRILPRRAAARAAATTIREISSHELEDDEGGPSFVGRRSPDRDYSEEQAESPPSHPQRTYSHNQSANSSSTSTDKHKCHICRRVTTCPIVVRQFGSDVHMCSNSCFNTFRNPDPSKRPLPCAHCGILHRDTDDAAVYYWETMNFCSDMCVAKYQIEVGGKCATCIKKVAWNCLGKYCVRFGSDIRQFCTATCLEAYKKNARVCFHCQLDIKRLGNVVLANIPAKASPKEFCSQDCVEMYIEQNLKQMVRPKPGQITTCVMCGSNKEVHKEMCTQNGSYKICSDYCWRQLLASKNINKPCKCESCTKYINMELDTMPAAHYISTAAKVHGFCSATCKNVFVLKNRSILACTSCKVKKYNFDLIEYISNKAGAAGFAVCSLNCIPKGAQYIAKIKELYNTNTYNSSLTASQLLPTRNKSVTNTVDSNTVPIISSVTSLPQDNSTVDLESDSSLQIQSVVTLADGEGETAPVGDPQDMQMQMYETYEEDGSDQTDVADEELDAELEEMKRLYEEVVEQLEAVTERDFYPEQRTVSCWAKPKLNSIETQTDMSELEKMERIEMVPQEKTIYVPVPIPYPVLLPFPFYALETPVPYPFPLPLPYPVPIPVIFEGTPKVNTNTSSDENMEIDAAETCDKVQSAGVMSDDLPPSPLPSNSTSRLMNETSKDGNGCSSPAGTSKTKSKPQILSDSGIKAWRSYFGQDSDPTLFKSPELGEKLTEFVNRVTRPTKEKYPADTLLYLSLGIQQYLRDNGRTDYIFYDDDYSNYVQNFTNYAEEGIARDIVLNRVDESNFWETTELGATSPGVLLFTVIYFNYKYFNLKTWEAHAALQFKEVVIVEREDMESGDKTKYLIVTTPDGVTTEIEEKSSLRERCPVRIFEFYQLKCASHEGPFYKTGNKIYTPRNEWFSEENLDQMIIYRMLVRAMMIKSDDLSR